MRTDSRLNEQMRPFKAVIQEKGYPYNSIKVSMGQTVVLSVVSYQEKKIKTEDTFTVQCSFFPHFTDHTQEIQTELCQFIKQSFLPLEQKVGAYHFFIDCLVLKADGNVNAAALNASVLSFEYALKQSTLSFSIFETMWASVNVGILNTNQVVVDLTKEEEKKASVLMTLVMNEKGEYLGLQTTKNNASFSGEQLNELLLVGKYQIETIIAIQKEIFASMEQPKQEKDVVVIATGNEGKAREFRSFFAPLGITVKTLKDFPTLPEIEETGQSFEENALLKAQGIANLLNCTVLADDSGLKVKALDDMPGIYSARFAGEQKNDASNNAKLLAMLSHVPKEKRQAQFYCALAVAHPEKKPLVVHGTWEGEIASIPQGKYGFGYDTLFYIPQQKKTAAQLLPEEKNKLSHRKNALDALKEKWPDWWKEGKK